MIFSDEKSVTSGDILIRLSTNGKCAAVGGESVMVAPSHRNVLMRIKRTVDGGFIDQMARL